MNKQIVAFIFFLLSTVSFSQDLKKIYKNLKQENLEKAFEEYLKFEKNNKYSKDDENLYDLASSLIFCHPSSSYFKPYEAYDIFYKINFKDTNSINKYLDKYDYNLSIIREKIYDGILIEAKKSNTELAYTKALSFCNACKFRDEVLNLKSELAYKECISKGTIEAYKYFIQNYKTSIYYIEIKDLMCDVEFNNYKPDHY
jgi:hypothetical protein